MNYFVSSWTLNLYSVKQILQNIEAEKFTKLAVPEMLKIAAFVLRNTSTKQNKLH